MLGVLLTVVIAIISVLLILVILVQNPKGGGLNSAFGGSAAASQIMGAARSGDMVEKITWGLASALLVFCLIAGLTFKGAQSSGNNGAPTLDLTLPANNQTAPTTPSAPSNTTPLPGTGK